MIVRGLKERNAVTDNRNKLVVMMGTGLWCIADSLDGRSTAWGSVVPNLFTLVVVMDMAHGSESRQDWW